MSFAASSSMRSFCGFLHPHLARARLVAAEVREHGLQLLLHLLHARRRHDLHAHRQRSQLELDLALVQLALAQHLADFLARLAIARLQRLVGGEAHAIARLRQQRIQHALFSGIRRAHAHLLHLLLARHLHRDVHELLHDGVHVAPDVAHFGELGGFHLHERRIRELREAARDLGLAHAGGPDHQDVLRRDFLAQRLIHLHAAPAVAQGDGHGALGGLLADDVLVQLPDDLARA